MKRKFLLFAFLFLFYLMLLVPQVFATEPSTYALSFNGSTDDVTIAYASELEIAENITISVWVKPNSLTQSYYGGFLNKGMVNASYSSYMMGLSNSKKEYEFSWYVNDTWYETWGPVETELVWVNLVGTYDGTDHNLYRNNVLVDSNSGHLAIPTTTEPLIIGDYFTYGFNGLVDDLKIFNRVLNSTEIAYEYNSGVGHYAPLSTTGLVGWWKFDEGSGTNLRDRTSNANHGTITGATWTTGIAPDWYSVDQFYIKPNYIGTLSATSFSSPLLQFTVTGAAAQTSITQVYCGTLRRPDSVTGASSYSYDSGTQILTVNVLHSSSQQIQIEFGVAGSLEDAAVVGAQIFSITLVMGIFYTMFKVEDWKKRVGIIIAALVLLILTLTFAVVVSNL